MAHGNEDRHREHADGRNGSSEIEQQHAVPEQTRVGAAQQCQVADDKKNARLVVSQIVLDAFDELPMAYPETTGQRRQELEAIREQLSGKCDGLVTTSAKSNAYQATHSMQETNGRQVQDLPEIRDIARAEG